MNLSPRQRDCMTLVCRGLGNEGIAETLGLSIGTVKVHLEKAFLKLQANGPCLRTHAAVLFTQIGNP